MFGWQRKEELSLRLLLRLWVGAAAEADPPKKADAEGVLGEKAELVSAVLCSGHQLLRHMGIPMVFMVELGACYSCTLM